MNHKDNSRNLSIPAGLTSHGSGRPLESFVRSSGALYADRPAIETHEVIEGDASDASLSSIDLVETNFYSTTFRRIQFVDVEFYEARFAGCAFLECTFEACRFVKGPFDGCLLVGCKVGNCYGIELTFARSTLRDVSFVDCELGGSFIIDSNFTNVTVHGVATRKEEPGNGVKKPADAAHRRILESLGAPMRD